MAHTSITRLDPFSFFDDLFRGVRSPVNDTTLREAGFVPPVDAHRDGEDLVLRADLPGIDPENDVAVELSGRTLTVSGQRRTHGEAEGLREVRYGSFSRTVTLPGEVTQDAVSADYDNGVLTVRVSGVYAQEQPQRIRVSSGNGSTTVTTGESNGQQ